MGALSRPGPQLGFKGPPRATAQGGHSESFVRWFFPFLRNELRPYPGRATLVLRMTLAATLTMLAIMTFRLPGAAIAGYYTLLLSRETPLNTVRAAATVMLMYVMGASYAMVGAMLFVDYPLTHFLWVLVSVFLCFYVIKVTTNYVAAAAFAFIITIVIPIWDTAAPTAVLVVGTLWAMASVSVGLICTIVVEYLFSGFEVPDELATGLQNRTSAVSAFLRALARNGKDTRALEQRVQQLTMVGVSRLRRLALSVSKHPERRSTTVALVGRIVDLAATLPHSPDAFQDEVKQRLNTIADRLDAVQRNAGRPRSPTQMQEHSAAAQHPIVGELERTLDLLELSSSANPLEELPLDTVVPKASSLFVADALTNREHLIYSARGCLAAMLCYVIFNAIAWRGLGTSLATCVITALTSVGASRQKQVLRISGAVVGGLIFGMGSQVLILPMLDSIAGFTVLFLVVTLIAAWIATSSPRISYFGQQIALAFYLIHLQEYFPQTNIAIGRDRVMGVGLGLVMMWLVFDTLGSKPAAQVMRDLFVTNLRLMAELARPWREGKPADLAQLRGLRDKISANFSTVNSQADAVLFEIGPSRERDLRVRDRLLAWQPRLRSLFLLQVALLQYRAKVHPDELAPEVLSAQSAFDERASTTLREMAESVETRRAPRAPEDVKDVYCRLQDAIRGAYHDQLPPRTEGVLVLSADLAEVLDDLRKELATEFA